MIPDKHGDYAYIHTGNELILIQVKILNERVKRILERKNRESLTVGSKEPWTENTEITNDSENKEDSDGEGHTGISPKTISDDKSNNSIGVRESPNFPTTTEWDADEIDLNISRFTIKQAQDYIKENVMPIDYQVLKEHMEKSMPSTMLGIKDQRSIMLDMIKKKYFRGYSNEMLSNFLFMNGVSHRKTDEYLERLDKLEQLLATVIYLRIKAIGYVD